MRGERLTDAHGPHCDGEVTRFQDEVYVIARRRGAKQGTVQRQCAEQHKARRVEQPDFAFFDERLDADRERRRERKPQREAHGHGSNHEIRQRRHEGEQQASFESVG